MNTCSAGALPSSKINYEFHFIRISGLNYIRSFYHIYMGTASYALRSAISITSLESYTERRRYGKLAIFNRSPSPRSPPARRGSLLKVRSFDERLIDSRDNSVS